MRGLLFSCRDKLTLVNSSLRKLAAGDNRVRCPAEVPDAFDALQPRPLITCYRFFFAGAGAVSVGMGVENAIRRVSFTKSTIKGSLEALAPATLRTFMEFAFKKSRSSSAGLSASDLDKCIQGFFSRAALVAVSFDPPESCFARVNITVPSEAQMLRSVRTAYSVEVVSLSL